MTNRVSVVIPAFNAADFLDEALDSVERQDYPVEIIVIDDASTDATATIAARRDVTLVRHTLSAGAGVARNSGVAIATCGLLAFLDADDLWTENSLSSRLAAIQRDPACDGVFGQAVQFGSGRPETSPAPAVSAGGMLIHREAFNRVGPFAPGLRVGEFLDWYARATDAGLRFAEIPDIVFRRRVHAENTMRTQSHVQYTQVLRETLRRRRQQ